MMDMFTSIFLYPVYVYCGYKWNHVGTHNCCYVKWCQVIPQTNCFHSFSTPLSTTTTTNPLLQHSVPLRLVTSKAFPQVSSKNKHRGPSRRCISSSMAVRLFPMAYQGLERRERGAWICWRYKSVCFPSIIGIYNDTVFASLYKHKQSFRRV